jgi:hypothetical protein
VKMRIADVLGALIGLISGVGLAVFTGFRLDSSGSFLTTPGMLITGAFIKLGLVPCGEQSLGFLISACLLFWPIAMTGCGYAVSRIFL